MSKLKAVLMVLLDYVTLGTILITLINLTRDIWRLYGFIRESGQIIIFLNPVVLLGIIGIGFLIHMLALIIKNIIR